MGISTDMLTATLAMADPERENFASRRAMEIADHFFVSRAIRAALGLRKRSASPLEDPSIALRRLSPRASRRSCDGKHSPSLGMLVKLARALEVADYREAV